MSSKLADMLRNPSPTVKEQIRSMLAVRAGTQEETWRGLIALPPGTLMERIVQVFEQGTDIPLELPFFSFFHIVAGYLLRSRVLLRIGSEVVRPDIWTVVLASSGSGKTLAKEKIQAAIGTRDIEWDATGVSSAARFLEELAENNERLWVRDEFAQFLRQVETPGGPMEEMKDYLLRIYDGARIRRATKQYNVEINEPRLVILGLTVYETFGKYVSAESMLDGFAQRFSYVVARRDPKRPMTDFPFYDFGNEAQSWKADWERLTQAIRPEYRATPEAIEAFKAAFQLLFRDGIPESFYRRLLWRAHKYALLYHVIRGQAADPQLLPEDYGWAARVIRLHLDDVAVILDSHGLSELEQSVRAAEKVVARIRDQGREPTARDLVAGVKAIRNAGQARFILEVLGVNSCGRNTRQAS